MREDGGAPSTSDVGQETQRNLGNGSGNVSHMKLASSSLTLAAKSDDVKRFCVRGLKHELFSVSLLRLQKRLLIVYILNFEMVP